MKTSFEGIKIEMTYEDLQNRIEQVAYDGATDGCNQAVIEREVSMLAREIVKLFAEKCYQEGAKNTSSNSDYEKCMFIVKNV